jgi:hypothetical protein
VPGPTQRINAEGYVVECRERDDGLVEFRLPGVPGWEDWLPFDAALVHTDHDIPYIAAHTVQALVLTKRLPKRP